MLTVHVFRCSHDPALCGYTPDRTGANLPAHLPQGEWSYLTTLQVAPGQDRVGLDCAALVRDVREHGYHLSHSGVPLSPMSDETSEPATSKGA